MEDNAPQLDELLALLGEDIPEEEQDPKKLSMKPGDLVKFRDWFTNDKDNRQKVEWQWFLNDSYVRGNHFVKWNEDTTALETVPASGVMRFPINKIYSTIRAIRGYVTKYDPKWDVYPDNRSDEAIKKTHYKQKLLDDIWYHKGLKHISKQKVFQGLKYSVGIVELDWDNEAKDVTFTVWDPYDIYFGGGPGPLATRFTKAVRKTLSEIDNDPRYKGKIGDITPSDDEYASEVKALLNQQQYGHQSKSFEVDDGSIVYETFYEVQKPNSLGGKVNVFTFTDNAILRHRETNLDSIWDKLMVYHSDENPGETYGEGWVKHLIPVQKMLDILESQTMEYHHMFAKGRYVVSKNSGVRLITNENGVILEHNPGRRPVVENAPSMAPSVGDQISRLNVYVEDLGGAHDATLGRIPAGATAGVAIEALQEGDANNLRDLTENFQIDLVSTAKAIFKMYAKNLKTTKLIESDDVDQDGKPDHFAIIGEDASNIPEVIHDTMGKEVPVCVIRKEEKVRVTVGSWLAYTREALEARVYKHYTAGLIDQQTALDALAYSDPDGIIKRSIREKMVNSMIKEGPPMPAEEAEVPPGEEMAMDEMMSPDASVPTPPVAG